VFALLFFFLGAAGALEPTPRENAASPAVAAGGRIAWIFSDDLDLLGDLRVDLPHPITRQGTALYLAVDTTTAIRRAQSFTFDVRDLHYVAELGTRVPRGGVVLSGFLQQWGKERVDAPGEPRLRSVGVGIESPGYHGRGQNAGVEGRAQLGFVAQSREIDANAVFHGDARYSFPGRSRLGATIAARVRALTGRGSSSADIELGPSLDIFLAEQQRASFFLRYLRASTPLGLETSGFVLGFEDTEGALESRFSPPDVGGVLAVGVGEGGGMGRVALSFLSPPFTRIPCWVRGDFDLNVLTADDTRDLYYLYRVGLETERGGATEGVYFHHRSNHVLAETGEVTSINVLEAGISTPGWVRPEAIRRRGRLGSVDAAARAGILLDTSFGKSGRPHAGAGIRWTLPFGERSRFLPYAVVEAEDGEVGRRGYGVGAIDGSGLDFRLEYRSDEQLQGPDQAVLLGIVSLGF